MRAGVKRELAGILGVGAAISYGLKRPKTALALAGGAGLLYALAREGKPSLKNQSVLITGGSRGLGLALAMEYARERCRVAILARDGQELARAKARIEAAVPGAHVLTFTCDVTNQNALHLVMQALVSAQGGLDILVNNAGAITVGPFASMETEDFAAQVRLHLLAVVGACKLALPYLKLGRGRRIVNICSMGGKVAVPHMLPYDASKFALSGFSQGLMAELAEERISVTTVYPAVMRTGSPMQAVFKGDAEKEFAWFAAADNLPGFSLPADSAAKKIVRAANERTAELVLSLPGRARNVLAAIFPEIFASVMAFVAGQMPKGESQEHRTGADSRALFDSSPWFWPLKRISKVAEKQWNQKPKHDARFNMGLERRAGG
jgi:short-subunit dehydrogenase